MSTGFPAGRQLEAATAYVRRGWAPLPLQPKGKRPTLDAWQNLRLTVDEVPRHFGNQGNVGLLLGPSGLADVDLDCPEAVRLAPRLLPPTPLRFGRDSRPGSHWLYQCPDAGYQRLTIGRDTLVELRAGDGKQTMFPPSVHPSGEEVRWEAEVDPDAEPAAVDADALDRAVRRIAAAALLTRHGWSDEDAIVAVRATEPPEGLPEGREGGRVREWCGWVTPAAPKRVREQRRTTDGTTEIGDAVAAYLRDYPAPTWPKSGTGQCPACGHNDCFGQMRDIEGRWSCFSASHGDTNCGLEAGDYWHGDLVDLHAHAAGMTVPDFLRSRGYLADRRRESPPIPEPPPDDGPPLEVYDEVAPVDPGELAEVKWTTRRDIAVANVCRILGEQPDVFAFNDALVHLTDDPIAPGVLRPVPLEPYGLVARMSGCAAFLAFNAKSREWVHIPPPLEAARAVLGLRDWRAFRRLTGLTRAPVLRPDGSVLQIPGYDERSGLLYQPDRTYPQVPENPTQGDAERAAWELLDVVCDFPFKADADKAAWISMILTIAARHRIEGPAPFVMGHANKAGAGKTALLTTGALIATGEIPGLNKAPSTDDEWDKRITTTLREGVRVEIFDNMTGTVGCASLDKVLTSQRYRGRILGKSENVEVDVRTVFGGTINNAVVSGDTHRRVLPIRLETDLERPENRAGFKHRNLLGYVKRNQPRLLVAALTILRAYEAAGRPPVELPAWGSYEAWSDAVRAPLVWAGLADPIATRADVQEQNHDALAQRRLLRLLHDRFSGRPFRAREVLDAVRGSSGIGDEIREVLEELFGDAPVTVRRVGKLLASLKDAWTGGMALRGERDLVDNVQTYRIERSFKGAADQTRCQVQAG